jgi:hypothetical protein
MQKRLAFNHTQTSVFGELCVKQLLVQRRGRYILEHNLNYIGITLFADIFVVGLTVVDDLGE